MIDDLLLRLTVLLILSLVWKWHHPGVSFWSWLTVKLERWLDRE